MKTPPRIAVMAIVLAVAVFTLLKLAASVFPTAAGNLGHDYRYFAPYLLAGEQWVRNNGWLSPAYFTASLFSRLPPRTSWYTELKSWLRCGGQRIPRH